MRGGRWSVGALRLWSRPLINRYHLPSLSSPLRYDTSDWRRNEGGMRLGPCYRVSLLPLGVSVRSARPSLRGLTTRSSATEWDAANEQREWGEVRAERPIHPTKTSLSCRRLGVEGTGMNEERDRSLPPTHLSSAIRAEWKEARREGTTGFLSLLSFLLEILSLVPSPAPTNEFLRDLCKEIHSMTWDF